MKTKKQYKRRFIEDDVCARNDLDKYKCNIHGNIGHHECSECWEALEKMCRDRKAFLIYDKKDKLMEKKK